MTIPFVPAQYGSKVFSRAHWSRLDAKNAFCVFLGLQIERKRAYWDSVKLMMRLDWIGFQAPNVALCLCPIFQTSGHCFVFIYVKISRNVVGNILSSQHIMFLSEKNSIQIIVGMVNVIMIYFKCPLLCDS